ncbi:MAG: iron ABC transporter permease [Clostridia bacterium]|nr:iron ABC transporter permease [Clostridia bacterium]
MTGPSAKKIRVCQVILLILLPLAAGIVSLCVGRVSTPLSDVWNAFVSLLTGQETVSKSVMLIVFNMRLPRILLAMAVGAGLSVAGLAFQGLFANPLATPDTMGIASGSGFGASLAILLGFSMFGIQLFSFGFGLLAVFLSALVGKDRSGQLHSVVLGGIMIGSLFSALISFLKFVADAESQLPAITYWLMGSFQSAGYKNLAIGGPIILGGVLVLFLIRYRMNLLPLPEEEIRASGVRVGSLRITVAVCATLITAACVSMCGQVGWVGLLVPHMARLVFGPDHRKLLPVCLSFGSAFMVLVDTAARTISATEIPVSVLTALFGAPLFVFLLRESRSRGRRGRSHAS